jgi:hypothetical protein
MKTKTMTLAGTAMAAVFAATLALPAQATTDKQSNASAKEITRQLNEGQMQHPGIVNGKSVEPDNAQYSQNDAGAANAAPSSRDELRNGVSLTDVPNVRSELQSAKIETRNGEEIGTVQSIEVNSDGTARAVKAEVNGRRVSLDPNNLVYLKSQNALVTDLSPPQIENMPPAGKSY